MPTTQQGYRVSLATHGKTRVGYDLSQESFAHRNTGVGRLPLLRRLTLLGELLLKSLHLGSALACDSQQRNTGAGAGGYKQTYVGIARAQLFHLSPSLCQLHLQRCTQHNAVTTNSKTSDPAAAPRPASAAR